MKPRGTSSRRNSHLRGARIFSLQGCCWVPHAATAVLNVEIQRTPQGCESRDYMDAGGFLAVACICRTSGALLSGHLRMSEADGEYESDPDLLLMKSPHTNVNNRSECYRAPSTRQNTNSGWPAWQTVSCAKRNDPNAKQHHLIEEGSEAAPPKRGEDSPTKMRRKNSNTTQRRKTSSTTHPEEEEKSNTTKRRRMSSNTTQQGRRKAAPPKGGEERPHHPHGGGGEREGVLPFFPSFGWGRPPSPPSGGDDWLYSVGSVAVLLSFRVALPSFPSSGWCWFREKKSSNPKGIGRKTPHGGRQAAPPNKKDGTHCPTRRRGRQAPPEEEEEEEGRWTTTSIQCT